jgi:hypothetical protein
MNDLTLLLVSEKDDKQGGLFQEYFHSFPGAVVTKNPHEDYESIDCLVIPCPSSFGHWKGHEIAEYYMGYDFGFLLGEILRNLAFCIFTMLVNPREHMCCSFLLILNDIIFCLAPEKLMRRQGKGSTDSFWSSALVS